jgi:hypothetical protein
VIIIKRNAGLPTKKNRATLEKQWIPFQAAIETIPSFDDVFLPGTAGSVGFLIFITVSFPLANHISIL